MDPNASVTGLARAIQLSVAPMFLLTGITALLVAGVVAVLFISAVAALDLAVIVGQPQLTPVEKLACWKRFNRALGRQGVAVDLVVAGSADAERLSGSRWHVFGDVAREGRVLYVAR